MMNKILFLLAGILSFPAGLLCQPVITQADMPSAGDTIRTRSSILGMGLNYQQAGNNITWDFSSLTSSATSADTYIAVSATPLVYQLAFNLPFDPNKANLASPQPDFTLIPGVPLTDIVNFYKKSTASYALCGFGATVSGLPLPVKFNTPEIIYPFPLSINSLPDSSEVSFNQGITGIGYLSIEKKRVNTVDGWGTVITPSGSYTALRLKSVVNEVDSLYIDSLSFGFALPRNFTEYKWLVPGNGIPVMTVSNQNLVTTFTWTDSSAVSNPFSVDAGNGQTICPGTSAQITAVPTGGTAPYFYLWSNGSFGPSITVTPAVTTTYSVTVTDAGFQVATASVTITVFPEPLVSISLNPPGPSGCSGPEPNISIFQLTATAGFAMYSWSTGISGPSLQQITTGPPFIGFVGMQDYTVTVTDGQGCSGDTVVQIEWMLCTGLDETQDRVARIYPNPCPGRLTVSLDPSAAPVRGMEVLDVTGRLLGEIPVTDQLSGGFTQIIDLKSVTGGSGSFLLRVHAAHGPLIHPILVY